jgi:alpha-1,2-mannosyltransferase
MLLAMIAWNGWLAHTMVTRLQMGDFRILYLSARAHLDGRDMYDLPSELYTQRGRTLRLTLVNLNPPHFQLLLLPLALLPAGAALGIWALASLLCFGWSLMLIVRELHLKPSSWTLYRGAVWLLAFAGTGAVLATAEMSFLLLLPLTLAWSAARQGHWNRAAAFLGFSMSLKLFLLIFIPYLVVRRRFTAAAISCSVALACFATGFLALGSASYSSWFPQLSSVHWGWRSANASIFGLLSRSLTENPYHTPVVLAPDLIPALWLLAASIIGLLTFVVVTFDRTSSSIDRAFALLLLAALLISPLGWLYYLWLGLGPLAALAVNWRRSAAPTATRWRQRLLILAVPGLVWPHFATFAFPTHAWATLTLASAYFWSLAALWSATLVDSWAVDRQTECSTGRPARGSAAQPATP